MSAKNIAPKRVNHQSTVVQKIGERNGGEGQDEVINPCKRIEESIVGGLGRRTQDAYEREMRTDLQFRNLERSYQRKPNRQETTNQADLEVGADGAAYPVLVAVGNSELAA